MDKRLKVYGIVILALSVFAVVVMDAPYCWVVGAVGLFFSAFFEVKSLRLAEKTVNQ